MTDLRNETSHFVARGALPEIDARTLVRQVFARLDSAGSGGFIMKRQGRPAAYVPAHDLALAVFSESDPEESAALARRRIGDLLKEHPEFSIRIEKRPVFSDASLAPLQDRDDAVFQVVRAGGPLTYRMHGRAGQAALIDGWLLNHESLRATITPKTVWRCENPDGTHDNADPDHGICYLCPFPTRPVRTR
jgi:hypothetical protein